MGRESLRQSVARSRERSSGGEFGREFDGPAAFAVGMEDRPVRDRDAEHFLETERLGAELGVVVDPGASPAELEFDGQERLRLLEPRVGVAGWCRRAGDELDLDDVALAIEAKPIGPDRQGAPEEHALGHFVTREVGVFVDDVPAFGVLVGLPPSFHHFQRRPPRAVKEVVEEAQRQRLSRFGEPWCCALGGGRKTSKPV